VEVTRRVGAVLGGLKYRAEDWSKTRQEKAGLTSELLKPSFQCVSSRAEQNCESCKHRVMFHHSLRIRRVTFRELLASFLRLRGSFEYLHIFGIIACVWK